MAVRCRASVRLETELSRLVADDAVDHLEALAPLGRAALLLGASLRFEVDVPVDAKASFVRDRHEEPLEEVEALSERDEEGVLEGTAHRLCCVPPFAGCPFCAARRLATRELDHLGCSAIVLGLHKRYK